MNVQLYKPKSSLLQNYIEYFYILTRTSEDEPTTYLTFPSTNSFVSINLNSTILKDGNKISIQHNPNGLLDSSLTIRYSKPLIIEYTDAANEITMCFKPLGLNAFLERPLNHYAINDNTEDLFLPYEDYSGRMNLIMHMKNDQEKITALEEYWLSKLKGFKHPFLYQVINMLADPNEEMTIAEIAQKYNITNKTLIKHFEQNICKSPSDFKKIARFRNSLNQESTVLKQQSLTDITYMNRYFDQSHMVKDFKALTGYTPKAFFKELSSTHSEKIKWIFPVTG